ncbi:L-serine ammonia-lyase, iron-sulfur-dependent subunit beta [Clostridium beijerinckii]|uniref:L-serine deaminase n=1 Tax=Clostridium beijerinckii TaxID=1520 RepID=A0AAW3W5J2_CLOBE|nr:L-serine ammonia-lyase, iron-sulfur-dependent subunit beta [Clostridium beijerinckii]MBC2456722.1 L-serine ammonia-lyase, iron-sulfur-dependent, subunit beta [Clostridium beijerinckii]MBC2474022.1 L-serine ammonia-lyase, iron-sulfur-dependent, subunit beta [Clostridium beijerinckii]MDG5853552.1 L-serine ammonia-lyase, iron-sulfur-dependent subunit beta [Clostridium beijerinckii]NOV61378.1 L-serine dehydratase [Clostridium beijerinckii]NOV69128.1 L-serine dehydratase [Clostridium beijerincki
MREYSAFDIVGPIMVGPSSSHTAGAARLGKVARTIAGDGIKTVEFFLHGSFATTYKGHGTDKALIAGILGMNPWDKNLRYSMELAQKEDIEIKFIPTNLGDVHPNTVKIVMNKKNGKTVQVVGSSIGGGNILVTEVDGDKLEFTGIYPTILINHTDLAGMVAKITAVLFEYKINIAFMRVYRKSGKGSSAAMVFEVDDFISQDVINEINNIPNVKKVRAINPVREEI